MSADWVVELPLPSAAPHANWPVKQGLPGVAAFERDYRMAVAMKGGVSLAVWIGGAVAELDLIRRIRIRKVDGLTIAYVLLALHDIEDTEVAAQAAADADGPIWERAACYAQAMIACSFDEVGFDVLAGASAGGLNAVLWGAAQRAGASADAVIKTWDEAGDLWKLLHPPGFGGVLSVLQGDDYFQKKALEAIEGLRNGEKTRWHPRAASERVVVELSATVLDPDPSDARGAKEGQGHFRFVGSEGAADAASRSRRIPPRGLDGRTEADLARLARAARTTSSFPGAFEPARLTSSVRAAGVDVAGDDFSFAFGAQRKNPDVPYRVVDGGVTDNIPIERALRSLRALHEHRHVERALLYLDPSPRSEHGRWQIPLPSSGPELDRQSRFLSAVPGAIARRGIRESGEQEQEDTETFRRRLYDEQGRDESLAVLAGADRGRGSPPGHWRRSAMRAAYVRYRSAADLDLLTRIALNPSLWQLGTDLPFRRRREPMPESSIPSLEATILNSYDAISGEPDSAKFRSIVLGPQARLEAATCALAWIRSVDELAHRYEQRGAIDRALARRAAFGGQHPDRKAIHDDAYGLLRDALRDRDDRLDIVLQFGQAVQGPGASSDAVVAAWLEPTAIAAISANLPEAVPRPGDPLSPAWWSKMERLVRTLRFVMRGLRRTKEQPDLALEVRQVAWAGIPTQIGGFSAADLAPFMAVRGIPDPLLKLRFWSISAAEFDQLGEFVQIEEGRQLSVARHAMRLSRAEVDVAEQSSSTWTRREEVARAKLAGSTLASFGGFLNKRWRRNDWWWGRIDACAGMMRIMNAQAGITPAPEPDQSVVSAIADPAQVAVDWLLLQMNSDPNLPYDGPAPAMEPGAIAPLMAAGAESVADLRAPFRVATASRLIRVLSRAVVTKAGVPAHVIAWVLRPLFVLTPLLLDPPRVILAVGAVMGLVLALDRPAHGDLWFQVTLAIALVLLAVAGALLFRRQRWWIDRASFEPLMTAAVQLSRGLADRAHVAASVAAAGAAVLVEVLASQQRGGVSTIALLLLEVALIAAGSIASRRLFRRPPAHRIVLDVIASLVAVALILAGAWIQQPALQETYDARDAWSPAIVAVGTGAVLFALSVLATWGWLIARRPSPWWSLLRDVGALLGAAVSAAFGALVVFGIANWLSAWTGPWADLVAVPAGAWVWGQLLWWLGEVPWLHREEPPHVDYR